MSKTVDAVSYRIVRSVVVLTLLWAALPARGERMPVRIWTGSDGLPGDRVLAALEDSRGLIWIGGDGWLARYDGDSFRRFGVAEGLPAAEVRQILETADGALWLATGAGPCRLDGEVHHERAISCQRLNDGATGDPIGAWSLRADSDVLWAATSDGLWRASLAVAEPRFERVALGIGRTAEGREAVRGLSGDGEGGLWLATARGVAHRSAAGRVRAFPTFAGAGDDRVAAVLRDAAGRLWIAHFGRGILVWWPPDSAHLPASGFSLDRLPVADRRPGALPFPARIGEVARITTSDGLPDDRFLSADGTVWAARSAASHFSGGLQTFGGRRASAMTPCRRWRRTVRGTSGSVRRAAV